MNSKFQGLKNKGDQEKMKDLKQALELLLTEYEEENKTKTLLTDYATHWIEKKATNKKKPIRPNTLAGYRQINQLYLIPYFTEHPMYIEDMTVNDINAFYDELLERVSVNTVKHCKVNIVGIFKLAVKENLITYNPALLTDDLPAEKKFKGAIYTLEQLNQLVKICKNTPLEVPVTLTVRYGLRRSEILGLRWQDIDFEKNTIKICHTAIMSPESLMYVDNTKSETSKRILPLFDDIKEYLQILKFKQKKMRELCVSEYHDNDYICKWEDGRPITPDYISRNFKPFVRKNGLPPIRFHDLRHSVASLMIESGISVESVKYWLGHSNISTTEIYIHLNFNTNLRTKNALEQALFRAV